MEGVNKIRDLEEKGEEDRVGEKGRFQQGDEVEGRMEEEDGL